MLTISKFLLACPEYNRIPVIRRKRIYSTVESFRCPALVTISGTVILACHLHPHEQHQWEADIIERRWRSPHLLPDGQIQMQLSLWRYSRPNEGRRTPHIISNRATCQLSLQRMPAEVHIRQIIWQKLPDLIEPKNEYVAERLELGHLRNVTSQNRPRDACCVKTPAGA